MDYIMFFSKCFVVPIGTVDLITNVAGTYSGNLSKKSFIIVKSQSPPAFIGVGKQTNIKSQFMTSPRVFKDLFLSTS